MTYLAKRYVIEEGPGWYLTKSGHPTRHLMTAQMWLIEEHDVAKTICANYARLNPKNHFTLRLVESLRPNGEWEEPPCQCYGCVTMRHPCIKDPRT